MFQLSNSAGQENIKSNVECLVPALLHRSSHSFFSCGPSDRAGKERGMFDGLLDSRRPENTSPGDTPTLSLICHPMQVVFSAKLISTYKIQLFNTIVFTNSCVMIKTCDDLISSRSCGSAAATLGSPRGHFLSVGTVRGWMWSLANTGSLCAPTVKVRGHGCGEWKRPKSSALVVQANMLLIYILAV